jgi:predicted RNA binding protein YcfA (HicA-like mRNA interferase family)
VPDAGKIKAALLEAGKDYGHRFGDAVHYLQASGWRMRLKGSHHIFRRPGIPILLNLQPEQDGKAKAYQIRQVRQVLIQFDL